MPDDSRFLIPTIISRPKQRNGLSDPYIVIALNGSNEQKTKIIKKTLDPVWDETFSFAADALKGDDTITLTFYDYDFGQKDDFMGEVVVPLSSLQDLIAEKWYTLEHRANETAKQQKEEVRGRVLVRMAFLSGCKKTIAAHLGAGVSSVAEGGVRGESDARENLQKLGERGEKLKGVGEKSQQLSDDAMKMNSLASSLKESLEEKNKGVFGGMFKH